MIRTPNLEELAKALEFRWRLGIFARALATSLIVSFAVSLLLGLVRVVFDLDIPLGRAFLLPGAAAIVVALTVAAARRRSPEALLCDADRVYETRELLSSAFEFATGNDAASSPAESAMRQIVAKDGDAASTTVDPATVYPLKWPRTTPAVVALALAVGILMLLDASGWFSGPQVELSQEGWLLEDAGRRLAQRSDRDELTELADEIRRLGDQLRSGQIDPDEARRRIHKLGDQVEEQIRNLERMDEFETNPDVEVPEEARDAVRSALRSGMTDGEVLDFFMSMKAGGETLPDALKALEEVTGDVPPDTDLDLDAQRVQELLDQLNLAPQTGAESDVAGDLDAARRSLQQAGTGLERLTEGEDAAVGSSGQSGLPGRSEAEDTERTSEGGGEGGGRSSDGQLGGETAVADMMNDTFTRIEDSSQVFRQIEGIIGEGTIRDVIIRELPSEAVSRMNEAEREVAFERVIEEAVGRENTPPELQSLVRNYFLRITLGRDQGDDNER